MKHYWVAALTILLLVLSGRARLTGTPVPTSVPTPAPAPMPIPTLATMPKEILASRFGTVNLRQDINEITGAQIIM